MCVFGKGIGWLPFAEQHQREQQQPAASSERSNRAEVICQARI